MSNDLSKRIIFDKTKTIDREPILDEGLYWIDNESGSWDGPHVDWRTHRDVIFPFVKNFNVCVQAGGNLGLYAKLLAERFKTVYTFEPDILNFLCLTMNVKTDNVIKINAALGSENKLVSMDIVSELNMGMNKVHTDTKLDDFIPMFTIDQLALRECDLIWLDIETYEKYAILGAKETIEKFKPIVVLESVDDETRNFLLERGYEQVGASISDKIFGYKG